MKEEYLESYDVKDLIRIYDKHRNTGDTYQELYNMLEKSTDLSLRAVKAELIAELESKTVLSMVFPAIALLMGFAANLFSVLGKIGSIIINAITITAMVIYCVKKFSEISGDFMNEQKNTIKKSKYILCVIEDIQNCKERT